MSEDEVLVASDWTGQACEELVLQTLPGARNQMDDFMEDDVQAEAAVQLQSIYFQNKDPSHLDAAPLNAAEQTIFGTCDGECSEHIGKSAVPIASLLPPEMCHHLGHCPSISLTESQIFITDQVIRQDGNSHQAKDDVLNCPVCRNEFKTPSELKEHFRSHPPPPQDFRCWQSDCPFLAQDLKRFQSHLRREHKLTPVSCSHRTCRLLFPSREEMSRHLRSHFPFHCNQCDFVSSNSKVFSQHRKSHVSPGEPYFTLEDSESRQSSAFDPLTDDPPGEHFIENVSPSNVVNHNSISAFRCRKRRKTSPKGGTENPESNGSEENGAAEKRSLQATHKTKNSEHLGIAQKAACLYK